jgi:hypothetical protein
MQYDKKLAPKKRYDTLKRAKMGISFGGWTLPFAACGLFFGS